MAHYSTMQLRFSMEAEGSGRVWRGFHVSVLNFSSPAHHREKQSSCCLAHGLKPPLEPTSDALLQSSLYPSAPGFLMLARLRGNVAFAIWGWDLRSQAAQSLVPSVQLHQLYSWPLPSSAMAKALIPTPQSKSIFDFWSEPHAWIGGGCSGLNPVTLVLYEGDVVPTRIFPFSLGIKMFPPLCPISVHAAEREEHARGTCF